MRFRRRRRGSSSRSVPSRKVWGGFYSVDLNGGVSPVSLTPNSFYSGWILSPNDASDFYDEPTVGRLIFNHQIVTNVLTANVANNYGAHILSCIFVSRADPAGLPPFLNPFDTTIDYLWWSSKFLHHEANMAFGFGAAATNSGPQQGHFDIRAKRKMPEGFGLAYQCFNQTNNIGAFWNTVGITNFVTGRVLFFDH